LYFVSLPATFCSRPSSREQFLTSRSVTHTCHVTLRKTTTAHLLAVRAHPNPKLLKRRLEIAAVEKDIFKFMPVVEWCWKIVHARDQSAQFVHIQNA
jgi:hypothetical protein